ncbi:superoxide dismutase family protein [Bacillus sp. FJAT-50079]|uniref:superoxide dismutase family protein n=1 Tax=Bacillus sp. FJAT-50079 TaxID=2833577 RepID=UPI0024B4E7B3|nr:superoxide dismutase family protein [Bacillus sp. FJAT-50079]
MKKLLIAFIILIMGGCANPLPKKIEVNVKNIDGDSLGKVTFEQKADGVKLAGKLEGLPTGVHGMHIHDKGVCKAPDFLSAGEHFNPDEKEHGLLHPKGPHAGDLPNLIVDSAGKVKIDYVAKNITLEEGLNSIYTREGTSLVIHEDADDGMSQPAGDAGERIACGAITKNRKPASDENPNNNEKPLKLKEKK